MQVLRRDCAGSILSPCGTTYRPSRSSGWSGRSGIYLMSLPLPSCRPVRRSCAASPATPTPSATTAASTNHARYHTIAMTSAIRSTTIKIRRTMRAGPVTMVDTVPGEGDSNTSARPGHAFDGLLVRTPMHGCNWTASPLPTADQLVEVGAIPAIAIFTCNSAALPQISAVELLGEQDPTYGNHPIRKPLADR
jgi:hypothetical protein